MKLLAIDDNRDNLTTLKAVVGEVGHAITSTCSNAFSKSLLISVRTLAAFR